MWFAWDGLSARWAADDMMNLYGAWKPGPWQLLLSQFRPWHGDYRPMGGAFYEVLFAMFGLNPLPYRVAVLLLLAFNLWLIYRIARLLGCDELRAAVAVVLAAYHAGLGCLHYNTDVIYDILCFTFYLSAFLYYAIHSPARPVARRLGERGVLRPVPCRAQRQGNGRDPARGSAGV